MCCYSCYWSSSAVVNDAGSENIAARNVTQKKYDKF